MDAKAVKYLVFLLLVALVIGLAAVLVSNADLLAANLFWIALLAVFAFLVWKFDVLLTLTEFQRAVIMRFGKVVRVGGPGWCLIIPGIEHATIVDLRTQTVDVPKQDVITKDSIELKIDAIVYLRIRKDEQSVINSVVEVEDYRQAIRLYIISLIREIVGSMLLSDVVARTEEVERRLQKEVAGISKGWGVEVVSVDMKDVDIPPTVLTAMHEEKAAVQKKLARMESAKAHMAEIEAVRKAAENLSDTALSYYYVRALEKMAEGKSTKFIFPMELSRLAAAIGGRVGGAQPNNMEELFKKYAPAITGVLDKGEKKEIAEKVVEKKGRKKKKGKKPLK